jgi:hypothetical protein
VTALEAHRLREYATSWTGAVTLPRDRGSAPLRLVVREYEWYASDANQDAPVGAPVAMMAIQPRARRIVYADALEI